MKNKIPFRFLLVMAALLTFTAVHFATPGGQYIQLPLPPAGPQKHEECYAYERAMQAIRDGISRRHQACLDANKTGPSARAGHPCSKAACEALHEQMDASKNWGKREYDDCTKSVEEYQERKRQEKEAAEERERQEKEAAEKLRQEAEKRKRDAEAAARDAKQKAEAEKKEKDDARAKEAKRKRDEQDANRKLIEMAREESQREKERLRERTEERERQKEQARERQDRADGRLNEAMQEKDGSKEHLSGLVSQVQNERFARTNPAVDPSALNPTSAFDIPSASPTGTTTADPRQAYEQQYDMAPKQNDWRDTWGKIKDYTKEKANELLQDNLQSLPDRFLEHLDKNGVLNQPDRLNTGISHVVNDLLDDGKESSGTTIGGWLKDKAANMFADWGTQQLRDQLNQRLQASRQQGPQDVVERAHEDVWSAANPNNLSKGLKVYYDNLLERFYKFFDLATDRFFPKEEERR